jgi:type 1 glutamine amidotransferase
MVFTEIDFYNRSRGKIINRLKGELTMSNQLFNVLVVGDYTNPPYHPLKNVEESIKEILEDKMSLTFSEDKDSFLYDRISKFDLCIIYADSWEEKLTSKQIAGLLTYVVNGGGLLVIHSGICFQSNSEFAQLAGAKFIGHPPYQKVSYKVVKENHPILEGIEDFEMDEELYTFEFDNFSEHEVILEATNGDITFPAVWEKKFGDGKVIYLAQGHDKKSFDNEALRRLLRNSALYILK